MTDQQILPLPMALNMTLGESLAKRRTGRAFRANALTDDELSTLLWACAGLTGDEGRRTVPSTLNLKAVSIWVLRDDGTWRYDPAKNQLTRSTTTDCRRASTTHQFDFVTKAPVTLAFVLDHEVANTIRESCFYVDAGTMGQSAYLAATALGLSGCIRASFDHKALGEAMALPDNLEPILMFTVGLPETK